MRDDLPEIAKLAARVAAAIEEAVSRFARRHRYTSGADLRNAARHVVRCAGLAWRDRQGKLQRVRDLSTAVDDLRLELTIADLVKAWGSHREMEAIARLINELGRQVGGWLKALHSKGQNAQAERHAQRAMTLSSPVAHEAM